MPSPRAAFYEDIQVVPQYEHLRSILLHEEFAIHRTKPLAFWTLSTDRRLPLVLLNRTLGELLAIPFDEICRTPSIGEKKVRSFLALLARAANTKATDIPEFTSITITASDRTSLFIEENQEEFDASSVSELQWQKWQQTIRTWGFDREKLGGLCYSLSDLTRVIWNRTLGDYCESSLEEMRKFRTHGEKRITAIIRIFHNICSVISKMEDSKHLVTRLIPKNIDRVERWTFQVLMKRGIPSKENILANYITPLIEQLRIDASEQICALAENRIGIKGEVTSIRQAAKTLDLARARIYQLLNEINDIAVVRWPNGRLLTSLLRNKFLHDTGNNITVPELEQFHAAAELFFPWGRREDASDDFYCQFMNMGEELSNGYETEPSEILEKEKFFDESQTEFAGSDTRV